MVTSIPNPNAPACPLPLSAILDVAFARGYAQHVSLSAAASGEVQCSVKANAGTGYHVFVSEEPTEGLLKALHPGFGRSWVEVLGDELGDVMDAWWETRHDRSDADAGDLEDIL